MPRNFLRRYLPAPHELRAKKRLHLFGERLHNPNLWHLNRTSVATAMSVGLFIAFVPVPFQMLLAAGAAVSLGCNLPIAVLAVWVSNPLTVPPLFYAAYKFGAWLLGEPHELLMFEPSFTWLANKIGIIWQPFLLGCLVLGLASAAAGNLIVRLLWRLRILHRWRERKARRGKPQSSA